MKGKRVTSARGWHNNCCNRRVATCPVSGHDNTAIAGSKMNGCQMSGDLNRFRKCFQPRQWFADEGDPESFINEEDVFMWVYTKVRDDNGREWFHVGYFLPDKTWFTESTYSTAEEAAKRVHYLMGGHS